MNSITRKLLLILGIALFLGHLAHAQSALPAPTGASSSLTMSCPSPATGSQVWRCTGTSSTCTLASNNWQQIGTIATPSGSYADSTGLIGQPYTYAGVCTDGAIVAPASNFYTGTPTSPLAAGTLTGTTS